MPLATRASEFGDAVHTVALARLRRRRRWGRWLLLALLLIAAALALWALAF
jgi:hypothetical protein